MTLSGPKMRDPTVEDSLSPAMLRRVVESLSARDGRFLELLAERGRVLLDTIANEIPCDALVWMVHFGVVATDVIADDRLFLELSADGQQVLDAYRDSRRVRSVARRR